MKKLKKDLRGVLKSLKTLARKTEKLVKVVDKLEKVQAVDKRRPRAKKAITTKKAPAKKKGAVKKTVALSATDQVVKIIKGWKKGVGVPTLIKKTGFEDKKIRNILNRASKQGKIKRAGRGIYIAA